MNTLSSVFHKLFGRNTSFNGNPDEYDKLLSDEMLKKLKKLLKVPIQNKSFYAKALIHRSYLEHDNFYGVSNERLEFLGDSVLSLAVAEYLFKNFPDEDEGFLTKVRAKFVNRNSLGDAAKSIGIGDMILIGSNLSRNFIKNSNTVLSDTLEAIIGAIYLDLGLEASKKFVGRVIIKPKMENDAYLEDKNYKSQLLEFAQANKMPIPVYQTINEEGPQHNRIFTVKVSIGSNATGTGKGKNKKSAEQNAAKAALHQLLQTVNSTSHSA